MRLLTSRYDPGRNHPSPITARTTSRLPAFSGLSLTSAPSSDPSLPLSSRRAALSFRPLECPVRTPFQSCGPCLDLRQPAYSPRHMRNTALQELVRLSHLRWQRIPMNVSMTRIAPPPQLPWLLVHTVLFATCFRQPWPNTLYTN